MYILSSKSPALHSFTVQEILLHKLCIFRIYTCDGRVIHWNTKLQSNY